VTLPGGNTKAFVAELFFLALGIASLTSYASAQITKGL